MFRVRQTSNFNQPFKSSQSSQDALRSLKIKVGDRIQAHGQEGVYIAIAVGMKLVHAYLEGDPRKLRRSFMLEGLSKAGKETEPSE